MWEKRNCVVLLILLISIVVVEGKRFSTGGRKTSSSGGGYTHRQTSSSSGHVTKPSHSSSASSYDPVKLSYPSQNAARPAAAAGGQGSPSYGWTAPKQQGPPPAYSPSNPVGGAKTNINEAPPAYRGNNAFPPSYGAATGAHTPLTATHAHGVQSGYPQQLPPGATYHSPGSLPAGATYYPSGGHMSYPAGGHYPAGGSYYPSGGVPAGATYIPAGASLPPGATYYSQPPGQSSGLGFGSGLAAGAIGGAILGHVLTPSGSGSSVAGVPAAGTSGDTKVIIINNGQAETPAPVHSMSGTTTIPADPAAVPVVPLAPMSPVSVDSSTEIAPTSTQMPPNTEQPPPPAPGGIICVPVRVNDTDPSDNAKMIEVEKIACYPAPPPPPPETQSAATADVGPVTTNTGNVSGQTQPPLAPMSQPPLMPESGEIRQSSSASLKMSPFSSLTIASMCLLSTILIF